MILSEERKGSFHDNDKLSVFLPNRVTFNTSDGTVNKNKQKQQFEFQ